MSKIQTRKSISVSGATYTKLKEYCAKTGETCSGVVEDLLVQLFDQGKPLTEARKEKIRESAEKVERTKFNEGRPAPELDEDTKASRKVAAERVFTF